MGKSTLSIDWEDFGQLFGKYHHGVVSRPQGGAIERQTKIILDMLDETNNKATFFVLGILAKDRAELVREIDARGHEIALHGQSHEAMFNLSPADAKQDLVDSYSIVTDIIGKIVHGYRAPFFSINESNLYVLEILSELGLAYDSSIFPLKMTRYGIDNFLPLDLMYELPNGKNIVELPLTVARYFGKLLPVSGGGYMRLMPKVMVNKVFNDFDKNNLDSMIYMHPYEFDTCPIDVTSNYPKHAKTKTFRNMILNFRWNLFRSSVRTKIQGLLETHQFITCMEKAVYVKRNGNSTKLLGC